MDAELENVIEELTTDKAMLEEKNEEMVQEINDLKSTIDELKKELKTIKAAEDDMFEKENINGMTIVEKTKTLAVKNKKLNEALFQMRDLVARAEAEQSEAVQELEEVRKQNDVLNEIITETEQELQGAKMRVASYQEQIDASHESTKLVEVLTEKNLALEEKLRASEKVNDDFEELQQMFDELSETYKHAEKGHQEDLEKMYFQMDEMVQERDKLEEAMGDAEKTILHFHQKIHERNEEIREKDEQLLELQEELNDIQKAAKMLNLACVNVASQLSVEPDMNGIPSKKLFETLQNAVKYETIPSTDMSKHILGSLNNILNSFRKFCTKLENPEVKKPKIKKDATPSAAIQAQARKEATHELKQLRSQLEEKVSEILKLGETVNSREKELKAMKLGLEMVEKELSDASNSNDNLEKEYQKLLAEYNEFKKESEDAIKASKERITELKSEHDNSLMGKSMELSFNQSLREAHGTGQKLDLSRIRLSALLLQMDKMRAKKDFEDISDLPELKVPEVVAGPYGSTNLKKYDEVSPLMIEARNLQKQFGRMLIEPSNPNQKSTYEGSLAAYQERVEKLLCKVQSAYVRTMRK